MNVRLNRIVIISFDVVKWHSIFINKFYRIVKMYI